MRREAFLGVSALVAALSSGCIHSYSYLSINENEFEMSDRNDTLQVRAVQEPPLLRWQDVSIVADGPGVRAAFKARATPQAGRDVPAKGGLNLGTLQAGNVEVGQWVSLCLSASAPSAPTLQLKISNQGSAGIGFNLHEC